MANEILVFVEQRDNILRKVSLELLSAGRKFADELGYSLGALIVGEGVSSLVGEVTNYGVNNIYLLDDAKLASYTTGAYTSALAKVLKDKDPAVVLFGNTALGKDLAPRLAQRLGVGLASDITGAVTDPAKVLVFTRPIYAGKAFEQVSATARPIMATVRPNSFPIGEPVSGSANVENIDAVIDGADLKAVIKDLALAVSERPELTDANVIVSGGRGMKGPENYNILEDLADTIGAAVGASRAAVDSGWRPQKDQVGQTGKTVSPTLYIAVGISGAIQHLAGMSSSKYIVAINSDPDANIFNVADYGIVGDLFEIVPLLKEEFAKLAK